MTVNQPVKVVYPDGRAVDAVEFSEDNWMTPYLAASCEIEYAAMKADLAKPNIGIPAHIPDIPQRWGVIRCVNNKAVESLETIENLPCSFYATQLEALEEAQASIAINPMLVVIVVQLASAHCVGEQREF